MNLAAIRQGLATRIKTISGLDAVPRVYDSVVPPVAVVANVGGNYDDDFDGDGTVNLKVLLLVSRASDSADAQQALDEYLNPTGAKSVKAKVDADPTLGGACDSARVVGWETETGFYTVGGVDYAGVELNIEVYA